MKKPRLGTNDWGTDDRGDEQGFFNSWVTRDERSAHHGGSLSPSLSSSPWRRDPFVEVPAASAVIVQLS